MMNRSSNLSDYGGIRIKGSRIVSLDRSRFPISLQSHFDKISWICNRNRYHTYAHIVNSFSVCLFIHIDLAWPTCKRNGVFSSEERMETPTSGKSSENLV